MSDNTTWDEIETEMRRIGFGMEEMGGLALSNATLADFRDFLRSIPDGAGYDEFLSRSRRGFEPSDEQLREFADRDLLDDVQCLVGRGLRTVTWSERARWLRWAADEIEKKPKPITELWSRCSFCERGGQGIRILGGPGGVGICRACAKFALDVGGDEPDPSDQPAAHGQDAETLGRPVDVDLNYDPRDETHVRPQVGFRLTAGAFDSQIFFRDLIQRVPSYHDAMLFDAKNGEVPGTIRFGWDTQATQGDEAAAYLRSLPFVIAVLPSYGRPIDAA